MIDLKLLLQLNDFKDLDDVALVEVAEHARLDKLHVGDRVVAEKMANSVLYLLKGVVEVQTTGGVHQTLQATSERAQSPVFLTNTPGHYARCTQPARLLVIEKAMIEKFGIQHQRSKPELDYGDFDTLPAGDSSLSLMNEITKLFQSKSITLPSLPEVALYINSILAKDDVSSKQLAKVVQMDPIITARVIQVANNMNVQSQCASIREAIKRIGLKGLRTIVSAVVLRDLFMPSTELIVRRFNQFYEHSIRVGVICYELAKHLPGFDKHHAFLAGVLHDIGVVPILVVADKHTELAYKASNLEAVLQQLKSYIGGVVLQQWGFDKEYSVIAKHAYDWNRQITRADYCDLVQVALMHTHLLGGATIDGPALFDLPAFKRLGMDKVNPVDNLQRLKDMDLRVQELVKKICK